MIYHTSTPTTSSHLFDYRITAADELEPTDGGAIVDAFDGIDALAINEAGTLVAMANTCVTGFCIGGAGISFVDAATRASCSRSCSETRSASNRRTCSFVRG